MATNPCSFFTVNATRTPEPKNGLHGTQKRVEFVIKILHITDYNIIIRNQKTEIRLLLAVSSVPQTEPKYRQMFTVGESSLFYYGGVEDTSGI